MRWSAVLINGISHTVLVVNAMVIQHAMMGQHVENAEGIYLEQIVINVNQDFGGVQFKEEYAKLVNVTIK
jgi:hypothetical protein